MNLPFEDFKKNDIAFPSILTWKLNSLTNVINNGLVPEEKNKLIYFDGDRLVSEYLMYSEGLVVDNNEDFDLCKEGADVSMSTVATEWIKWGGTDDSKWWGYYPSDSSKTGQKMDNSSYNYTYTNFYMNGQPEGYIYNTKNTDYYTGYYSNSIFKDYTSHLSVGIMSENGQYSTQPSLNDYMSVVPLLNVDDTTSTTTYYGLSVSIMNASVNTNSRYNISGNGNHTISVECWKLTNLTTTSKQSNDYIASLLNDDEGLSIIPYDEKFNNSSSNDGLASVIQTKIKKENDILTLWFSDPYSTYDDDGEHQVYSDRPVIINLNNNNMTFTDMYGNTTTKDFSNDANIVEIFTKLRGGARRGYEVYSNPGSIFRNITSDELILNMTPDTNYNTTWKHSQDNGWVNVTQEIGTPMQLFSGSRLAYNSITKKLFYSNGDIIYQIAENKDNIEVDLSDYYTKNDVDEIINNIQDQGVEYTSGSNISIDENNKISALGYTYDVQKKSFAEGNATVANGIGSHSEGEKTFASGYASHAEGFETIASGVASHSEGAKYENNRSTESAGQASHAEGASTYAKADGSHAEGILNIAGRFSDEISTAAQELGISGTPQELAAKLLGYGAHAEGMNNKALGSCSHSEGNATKALANSTHAEGDTTIAFGEASHAEGYNTQAKGNQSHAEGSNTVAIGNSSHTEGTSTTASGSFSHAEGSHTEASGRDSHAEGSYNKAIGIASHAEGDHTIAEGEASHAEGTNTIAKNHYEHAEGKFNISNHNPDNDYPAYNTISSIGIGIDEDNRKNAFEVMQNGDIYIIGVGDYDGTNFENSLTLQETIKNTINVVRVKELFEDVTPEEEITVQEIYDLYHYSDTGNGGKFYKIVNNKYVETNENIKPNIYYKWVDTLSADKKQETIDNGDGTTTIKDAFVLDLTFDTPQNQNILNEYMIEFISGSKIPGIQIKNVNSEKIYWNSKPSLLQNALHQIHIVNNLGVIVIGV